MQKHIFLTVLIATLLSSVSFADAGVISKPANQLGLVGFWSFNEGSGTSAGDSSGKRNTGSIVSSPPWVHGKTGKALSFDGDTQYVDLGKPAALDISGAITISAWIKPSDLAACGSGCDIVSNYNSGGNTAQYEFYLYNNEINYGTAGGGSDGVGTTNSPITQTNRWYHVVVTRNNSGVRTADTVRIYVDGVEQPSSGTTGTPPSQSSSGNTTIGRDGDVTSNQFYFPGAIDEVRIYNRDLTQTEVGALYKAGAVVTGSSAILSAGVLSNGLVGHWTFDGADFAGTITDRSSSGINGYVIGGATSSMKRVGKIGQAIRFDGVNDSAEMGTSNTFNFTTGDFSVAFWIKVEDAFYDTMPIIYRMENGISGWAISTNVDKPELLTSGNGGSASNANTSLRRGVWEHVVVVRSGGTTYYYLNGASDGSGAVVSPASNAGDDLTFGTDDLGSYIAENLDDVRIYNRALSAAEAKQLYRLGAQKINAPSQTLTNGSTLKTGLIGHWAFDGVDITDKIYGKVGVSGYFTGVAATSSAKTIGKMGQAVVLDGTNDYMWMPDDVSVDPGDVFTYALWVKRARFGINYETMFSKGFHGAVVIFNGSNQIVLCGASIGCPLTTTATITDTNWHHYAITKNGTAAAIYIDGTLSASTNSAPSFDAATSYRQYIGADNGIDAPGASVLKGSLDDFRVYNRVLSSTEIKQLYNIGR